MKELILYTAEPSRGMIVKWLLEELGEPYELKVLDLEKQQHKTPEYLAINPMGRVPTLCHGDRVVTETGAICMYLAETFAGAGLSIPVDSEFRADYLRWMFYAPVTAEASILWKTLGDLDVEYQPFADIEDVAGTLQQALCNKKYIVGDRFTAADVLIGSTVMWGLKLMPVLPALPELVSYWQELEKRPAWQRVAG